jgi:hypothetical protein
MYLVYFTYIMNSRVMDVVAKDRISFVLKAK